MKRPVKPKPAATGLRRGPQAKANASQQELNTRRLLHELQVRQVELELQNTELQESRDRAETLLGQYTDLYDFAPAGYFTLTAEGIIQQLNLFGASLFDSQRSRLVGQSFALRISAEQRPEFHAFLAQVFTQEAKQECDFEVTNKTHPCKMVKIRAQRTANKSECSVVLVDITERQQAEAVLRRSEALFSALIEQAPLGVYVVDAAFRMQQVNAVARPLFINVQPLIGRDFTEIVRILWPRRIANQALAHFRHTLKTGDPYQSPEFSERRRDSGLDEVYEWQIQRVTLPDGKHRVVCFFSNITERKRAEWVRRRLDALTSTNQKLEAEIVQRQATEKQLKKSERHQGQLLKQMRELSHQILHAQEEERKRISRELHDVIAQTLVGINVHLATLTRSNAGAPKELQQKIARTQRLVEQAADTVHQFARELRPSVLDDLGLVPALESFITSFTERTGVRLTLHVFSGLEEAIGTRRTVLYRIAQEALTNVSRHAKASAAEVNIRRIKSIIRMEITDNGKGFDADVTARTNKKNRLGLLGMRERVEMIGGTFCVESAPGQPTTVRVEISVEASTAKQRLTKKSHKETPLKCL